MRVPRALTHVGIERELHDLSKPGQGGSRSRSTSLGDSQVRFVPNLFQGHTGHRILPAPFLSVHRQVERMMHELQLFVD